MPAHPWHRSCVPAHVMVMRFVLPAVAILGLILGGIMVFMSLKAPPTPPLPFPPPVSPFAHSVAGAGMVEASTEDILIGTPFGNIVADVYVTAGEWVQAGAPLFKLDTRTLESELEQAKAALSVALMRYQRELALPRPEDVPVQEDVVREAQANYLNRVAQFELYQQVENKKAISIDDFNQRKYAADAAKYAYDASLDRLALLLDGAWVRDLAIVRAQVKEARAHLEVTKTNLERSTIRAPFTGVIFRVNIHPGEFASAGELADPLIIMGAMDPLHVRVDIDEADVWRVMAGASGIAYVRGNSGICVPLTFVRLEPYLVPKRFLTGDNTEQIDTRVLQLIYEFDRDDHPIYPGEVLDVFVEGKPNKAWECEIMQ